MESKPGKMDEEEKKGSWREIREKCTKRKRDEVASGIKRKRGRSGKEEEIEGRKKS